MAGGSRTLSKRSAKSGDRPYYELVPKDADANLEWRLQLIDLGAQSLEHARDLWIACRRDPLFYINSFLWTYDPRLEWPRVPFITYEYQDEAVREINAAIGDHDLVIEKSRDMGASWLCLAVFLWRWHFYDMQSFLLVSRKEELVDKAGDPKSLFWKIDFMLKHMPEWLRPRFVRQKLHLLNMDNGSTIDGESTTGDVARGDRRTAILLDEFASVENGYEVLAATADATVCRIFNSTPKGTANAFYDVAHSPDIKKLRFHWSMHPEKGAGLYYDADGKMRSPWYDAECKRRVNPVEIAQELDIDYGGSVHRFFDETLLTRLERECVRPPARRGRLEYDYDTLQPLRFVEDKKGQLLLWAVPDAADRWPSDRAYVVGVDVATGTDASNSCISVADARTGEKVAEFATGKLKPHELAREAVAICR